MNNIINIFKREYLTQVKKRSFVVLTFFTPLLVLGFVFLVSYLFVANKDKTEIYVLDSKNWLKGELKSNKEMVYIFRQEKSLEYYKKELQKNEEVAGVLVIPNLENEKNVEKNIKIYINKEITQKTKQKIQYDLTNIFRKKRIEKLGLKVSDIENLEQEIQVETQYFQGKKGESDTLQGLKYVVSIGLVYIIFMFIIMYGVRIMRSVLEEKNNRVVEIIISSVKPFELMIAKILAITMVAFTQFGIWILILSVVLFGYGFYNEDISKLAGEKSIISSENLNFIQEIYNAILSLNLPWIFSVFLIFFLFGYLFYSSIYAAIGAAVDNDTETQQFTLLATLPLSLGLYGSMSVMDNPYGDVVFWLSMIPFTSPITMVARIPFGVALWEVFLSFFILVLSSFVMVWIASKIYRIGILTYGSKVNFSSLWKWIKS